MDIIYYHKSCPDGWTAAYIAKKRYPEAQLRPLDHGLTEQQVHETLKELEGKDVIMLDYSFRLRKDNDWASMVAKSFRILDHHKSAQANLAGADYAVFDMERSGAGLAWDYLFGKDSVIKLEIHRDGLPTGEFIESEAEPRPWFVDYIEDRDLWTWKLPNGREVCAYLDSVPWTVEAFDNLKLTSFATMLEFGRGAVSHLDGYVERTVTHARDGNLLGHKVKIVNAAYSGCSEIGNVLAKQPGVDFSISWFERADDIIQFSLRGTGKVDVSEIAKRYGGGGHFNAAGFQLPYVKGRILVDLTLNRPVEEYRIDGMGHATI